MPFPTIAWCADMLKASVIFLDNQEPYRKMTFRNKYEIATANGRLKLSIPLLNGRNQRVPMSEVQIFNEENWQQQHYKSIKNAYNRSPFFEYYEPSLQDLLLKKHQYLVDLNMSLVQWLEKQLKMSFNISQTNDLIPFLDPNYKDVRDLSNLEITTQNLVNQVYPQVFMDKIDFISNASILDLLFCMGPTSIIYLKDSDL